MSPADFDKMAMGFDPIITPSEDVEIGNDEWMQDAEVRLWMETSSPGGDASVRAVSVAQRTNIRSIRSAERARWGSSRAAGRPKPPVGIACSEVW